MKINSNTILVTKESSEFKELESVLTRIAAENNLTNVNEISIIVDHSMSIVGFKTADTIGVNDPSSDPNGNDVVNGHKGLSSDGTPMADDGVENSGQHFTTARIKSDFIRQTTAGEWPTEATGDVDTRNDLASKPTGTGSPTTKSDDPLAEENDGASSPALSQGKMGMSTKEMLIRKATMSNTMVSHGQAKFENEFTKEGGKHGQSQLGINTILEKKSVTKDDYTPKTKEFSFNDGGTELIPDYIKNRTKIIFTPTTRMAFDKVSGNTYRDKFASKLWTLKEKVGEDGNKTMYLVAIETDDTIKE